MSAKDIQIAGTHYKQLSIQPIEYILANKLGYIEGNIVKYVSRWKNKGKLEDLRKAKHYLELLIEEEVGTQELKEWQTQCASGPELDPIKANRMASCLPCEPDYGTRDE